MLQVGAAALGYGVEAAPAFAVAVVVGVVVPVLTYAFLASIWFLKVCADQLRGGASWSAQAEPRKRSRFHASLGPA